MRFPLTFVVLLIACTRDGEPAHASAQVRHTASAEAALQGSWRGSLSLRVPNPEAPAPTTRSVGLSVTFRGDSGWYDASLASMIGHDPPDRGASGTTRGVGDSVFLRLGGATGADQGELELYGRLVGDSITGYWSQVYLVGGARGDFALRRQ